MIAAFASVRDYLRDAWKAWNDFWFTPTDPATLALLRLLAGTMMFYTHLIWSFDLEGFVGPEGYTPVSLLRELQQHAWSAWSLFFWIKSTWALWTVHLLALAVFFCLAIGFFSRTMAVLGYLLAVSYAQRVTPGAYFGLDKANCMMAMYLMLGPCGARYSVDRLLKLRRGVVDDPPPSTAANVALRLIQLHLCVIYLFSALAKLEGDTWKLGTAITWAGVNYEYQSLSLAWIVNWPILAAVATHGTVLWELFYCCLVWNRFTRPLILGAAILTHAGIALCMGMITFGLAMIFANLSFLRPSTVRRWVDPLAGRVSLALVGKKVS